MGTELRTFDRERIIVYIDTVVNSVKKKIEIKSRTFYCEGKIVNIDRVVTSEKQKPWVFFELRERLRQS